MAYGTPMSQMADAAKLSIPQLQQALRDGTIDPQVGQLVLNSKIIADKKSKMAMQAQQPAQPPVVAQNAAYGQGVDTLPSNLPTITAAGGGIIAFAGEDESLVPKADAQYNLANEQAIGGSNPYAYIPAAAEDLLTAPFGYRTVWDPKTKTYRKAKDIEGLTPRLDALNTARAGRISGIESGIDTLAAAQKAKAYAAQAAKTPFVKADPNAAPSPQEMASLTGSRTQATDTSTATAAPSKYSEDDYNFGTGKTTSSLSTRTKGGAGIGSFDIGKGYKTTPYDDTILKELAAEELNPETKKPYTYEELRTRNKTRGESEGIDYGMYKKQAAELEGKKTRSEARIKLDEAMPWLAASEALGKSKSQFAIEGLTAGLGAYGRTAAEVSDKEEARLEGIRKEGNQLALAQNQFNQAVATGNRADMKSAEDAVKQSRMNMFNLGVKKADKQDEVAKNIFEAQTKLQGIAMQEAGANARYGQEQQTISMIAAKVHAAHPEMAPDEVLKQAYLIKGAPAVFGTESRETASQRAAIAKQISDVEKVPAFMTSDKAAKEEKLAVLRKQLAALDSGVNPNPAAASPLISSGTQSIDDIMKKYR